MKNTIANFYQDKIGKIDTNLHAATAGSVVDYSLKYVVGKTGLAEGAGIKVLFRISSDVAGVQFAEPSKPNFVSVTASKNKAKLVHCKVEGKINPRPWNQGFLLQLKQTYLSEGDVIKINFKNWRMQTFLEDSFKIKLLLDPFATGWYFELGKKAKIKILPDKPDKLKIIAPSCVSYGEKFKFLVKLEDQWGNPCLNKQGYFSVKNYKEFGLEGKKVKFKKGRSVVLGKMKKENGYIKSSWKHLTGISNPIVVSDKKYYWADLHWQSEETCGTGKLEKCLDFAKNYAFLDIASCQGNDFEISNSLWKKIKSLAKVYTDNNFIFFCGYEWSGNRGKGGDRNIIFLHNNEKIYRSSHALLDDYQDIKSDCPHVKDLYPKLNSQETLVIPHVGGRQADLNFFNSKLENLVEIHSVWGTFEWFYLDALERGYKVGVVANSDGHHGKPGASYPGLEEFDCFGGLTCVLANNLTKKKVFKALKKRKCYATTGERIYIDAVLNYSLKGKLFEAEIGEKLPQNAKVKDVQIVCKGTAPIENVEIYNKSDLLYENSSEVKKSKFVKIAWSGGKKDVKKRKIFWDGEVEFPNNKIISLEKVNIFNHTKIKHDKNKLSFKAFTTGNTQAIIVELSKKSGVCKLDVNKKQFETDINKPVKLEINKNASIKFLKVNKNKKFKEKQFVYTFKDKDLQKENAVFIKLSQINGQTLWTSPFFF